MKSFARFPRISDNGPRVFAMLIAFLAMSLVAFAALPASAQTAVAPAAGDGLTTDTAYQLTELGNLVWLQAQTISNKTLGKYFKLMNDINASATISWNDSGTSTKTLEGFNPIGYPNGSGWPFKGVFLGEDHMITGLYIHRTVFGVGLFGGVGSEGRIYNIRLVGGTVVSGDHSVGGLVGHNQGIVWQCSNTGSVDGGGSDIGCLVGYNDGGTVTQCFATGAVMGNVGVTTTDASAMGGLVGTNTGLVSQCYATGTVTTGNDCVGGLVGNNYMGTITQCHATGVIKGDGYVGGLCGGSSGTVSKSYATGAATGSDGEVGGLVGHNMYGMVTKCYATGRVTGSGNANGGLAGYSYDGTISECYAIGSVSGAISGGLLGGNNGTVANCYSLGAVSGPELIGGLVGNGSTGITNSYWNTQTSGLDASAGGTGKTTAQMKQQATFSGWEFTTSPVWGIQGAYPYLTDLTTCTLAYRANSQGQVGDGLTTQSALVQLVNMASAGTSVTATASSGHQFRRWSDGVKTNPRAESRVTTSTSVTAIFFPPNAARGWVEYR